jgi:hypothetical protein
MSLDGQVLCQRMWIGDCALTTVGAAIAVAAATVAPLRKSRRALLPFACNNFSAMTASLDMGAIPTSPLWCSTSLRTPAAGWRLRVRHPAAIAIYAGSVPEPRLVIKLDRGEVTETERIGKSYVQPDPEIGTAGAGHD